MALEHAESSIHWNYFLALEQDFGVITRYIEPCKDNEDTYSIELSRIIMASAQEAVVLFKALCNNIEPDLNASSIADYYSIIKTHLPEIMNVEVFLERYTISSTPFSSWSEGSPPDWWTANNKIKHHRTTQFQKATMRNAVESISALLILILYFYKSEIERINQTNVEWFEVTSNLVPSSNYFCLEPKYYDRPFIRQKRGS